MLAVLIERMLGPELEVLNIAQGEEEGTIHSSRRDRTCEQPAYNFLYKWISITKYHSAHLIIRYHGDPVDSSCV